MQDGRYVSPIFCPCPRGFAAERKKTLEREDTTRLERIAAGKQSCWPSFRVLSECSFARFVARVSWGAITRERRECSWERRQEEHEYLRTSMGVARQQGSCAGWLCVLGRPGEGDGRPCLWAVIEAERAGSHTSYNRVDFFVLGFSKCNGKASR